MGFRIWGSRCSVQGLRSKGEGAKETDLDEGIDEGLQLIFLGVSTEHPPPQLQRVDELPA